MRSWLWMIVIMWAMCGCSADETAPASKAASEGENFWTPAPVLEVSPTNSAPVPDRRAAPPTPSPPATTAPTAQPASLSTSTLTIRPNDERIRYDGRFDFSDPLRPAFDWSGVSIAFTFNGTALTLLLQDGHNHYNVWIDGDLFVLETEPSQNVYKLADDLTPGEHLVKITKRTEAYVGAGVLEGLQVTGGDLSSRPVNKGRLIEFIGDSITTGYGNEGTSADCWFTPATQNVENTYAAFTATELEADYTVLALSGLGVVRNLRGEANTSAQTAVNIIDRALALNPTVKWPAKARTPDAVVINLGTNDFSSEPFPENGHFIDAYLELLRAVRARYPSAYLFAVSGPLMLGPAPRLIAEAVDIYGRAESDDRVLAIQIENDLEESSVDFGCDWHPNVSGHRKIAAQLGPTMADALGWE